MLSSSLFIVANVVAPWMWVPMCGRRVGRWSRGTVGQYDLQKILFIVVPTCTAFRSP